MQLKILRERGAEIHAFAMESESYLKIKLLLKLNPGKDKTFGCFFQLTKSHVPLREILCAILKGENPCLTKEVLLSEGELTVLMLNSATLTSATTYVHIKHGWSANHNQIWTDEFNKK